MKNELTTLSLDHSVEVFYTGGIVQWSVDGQLLFAACGNHIKVLNVDDQSKGYTIGDVSDELRVTTFLLLDEDRSMVVAYANGLLRSYRLPSKDSIEDGAQVHAQWKSTHLAPILVIKCSESNLLATGSADFTVKVWKVNERCCIGSFRGTSAVSEVAFIDDNRIIIGYMDGSANMYLMDGSKKLAHKWKNHTCPIISILKYKSSTVLFVSRDQTISIVDVETHEKLKTVPVFEPIESAAFVEENLYTVGEEGVIKCWNADSAKLIRSSIISRTRIDSMLYNDSRKQFLLATSDFNICLVDKETLDIVKQFVGFNDEIFDIVVIGPGSDTVVVAANSPELRCYDMTTWSCNLLEGHKDSVLCVQSAAWNHSLFASASKDKTFIIWHLLEEKAGAKNAYIISVVTGHTNDVTALRFSCSSKHPFIVSVSNDTTLKMWPLRDLNEKSKDLKLSSSATMVAHAKDITCLDVSVNDRLCITGSMDKTAKLWHIDTEKMHFTIAGTLSGHRRGVWDARFSASTETVVTSSGDCMVRIYSLSTRECMSTLSGHPSAVLNAAIVNGGKQVVSADSGGLIKIWSIVNNECINTIEAHDEKIWALNVAENESCFITTSSDGRIRIWKDTSEAKREEECKKLAEKARDEQILTNLIEQKRYDEALSYSLTLSRPYNCLKILQAMANENPSDLRSAIVQLHQEEIAALLMFATEWNTNSRTADIAQLVLYQILHSVSPTDLIKMPNFASFLEAFIPYTNRHYDRLTRARQATAFLNYTWSQMRPAES